MDKNINREAHMINTKQIQLCITKLIKSSDEDLVVNMIACRSLMRMHGINNIKDIDDVVVTQSDEMFNEFKDFTANFNSMINGEED